MFKININIDCEELSKFQKDILDFANSHMPKQTKTFIKKEANKLATKTKQVARNTIGTKTGNYLKSIKSSKAYEYDFGETFAVRVYPAKSAKHGHLLEYGHDVTRKKKSEGGKVLGVAMGHSIFNNARKEYEKTFELNLKSFTDKVFEDI